MIDAPTDAPKDGEAPASLELERQELIALLNLCAFGFMTLTMVDEWNTSDENTKRMYHFVKRAAEQASDKLGADPFNALQARMAKLLKDRFEARGSHLVAFDVDDDGRATPIPKKRDVQ